MYIDHTKAYIIKHTRMWKKTWIALLISRMSKENYNQFFWPSIILSVRSPYSTHEKLRSPNTMILQQETNNTSLQDTKFQPLDLWDEGSIYRCLQGGWVSLWDLISVLSLIVLDSTWRMMISYSSLGEFREASVTGEVSRRFHDHPPRTLPLPFVHSHPSHPIEGIFSMNHTSRVHLGGMHRTLTMEQVRWSSFDQFWVVFHGELLGDDVISWPCSFRGWNNTFRDLGALGLWTCSIGVAVPKNVYNKSWMRK